MRVTHVITRLIIGGAQENTVATVLGLRQRAGMETALLAGPTAGPEGSLESAFQPCPQVLSIVPSLVRPVHPLRDILALFALTRIFRSTRPDIVHTHSGKAGILGRWAAHRAGVPVVVHTIHGPSFGPFQGAPANGVFRGAERFAARFTTHYVSVAEAMTRQYLAAGLGRAGQYTRIFSGFPLQPFLDAENEPAWRARLGLAPDDFVIGMISRLFKLKGHDDLLDIAPRLVRQCPRAKFLLVGDGAWRARLENRARDAGLEKHFVFAGLVAPAEVPRHVGIMDALAHLSRREGLPRALPQALAAARPVVAYDCDGAGEVCIDNETGFLVPPGDRETLARRLLQLAGDPDLRRRLAARGREFVRPRFAVETMLDELHALYLKLAAREAGS
ncbi:MAG TPA: glycosyltransferase family 4 protein [Candidatus Acidoferrum sp.]|nr:glycosyltransferase family 4 protein [Candidatus Acidoferrum sp.]